MPSPFDQSRYQVRFDWGVDGLARLAPSHITVVVDVLWFSTAATDRVAVGERVPIGGAVAADAVAADAVAADAVAAASDAVVLLGCLRNARAVARVVAAEQQRRGARTSVAVIAMGGRDDDAPTRFAVEDLLGAGAVIDALAAVGIDHSSPEAAAACEAFRGLRGALRHVLTASGSGQQLLAHGRGDEVRDAAILDATDAVPLLRGDAFVSAFGPA